MDRNQRSDEADALCASAYAEAGAPESGCALVAVGGYGRRELAPYSDLDIVLVHEPGVVLGLAGEKIWYPIWDSGAKLDHSVRTSQDMIGQADADVRVALGLLDLRHLAGDPNLTLRLRSDVLAHWRRTARSRMPELRALVTKRHELMGELAHLSVPDLKESEGGLRDATVLKALVATWLVDVPHVDLERSRLALLDVRDALHATAGRATDRVAPELWGELAQRLDLARRGGGAAVRPRARSPDHPPVAADLAPCRRRPGPPRGCGRRTSSGPARRGAGHRPGGRRGRARTGCPSRRGPDAAAPCRRGRGRACVPSSPRPLRPGWSRSVPRCRTRGPTRRGRRWCGCWPPGRGCSRSGRPWRRPARWTPSCPSGSGSGCSRTRRRSTASPSTVTSSRPAWRRRP